MQLYVKCVGDPKCTQTYAQKSPSGRFYGRNSMCCSQAFRSCMGSIASLMMAHNRNFEFNSYFANHNKNKKMYSITALKAYHSYHQKHFSARGNERTIIPLGCCVLKPGGNQSATTPKPVNLRCSTAFTRRFTCAPRHGNWKSCQFTSCSAPRWLSDTLPSVGGRESVVGCRLSPAIAVVSGALDRTFA